MRAVNRASGMGRWGYSAGTEARRRGAAAPARWARERDLTRPDASVVALFLLFSRHVAVPSLLLPLRYLSVTSRAPSALYLSMDEGPFHISADEVNCLVHAYLRDCGKDLNHL